MSIIEPEEPELKPAATERPITSSTPEKGAEPAVDAEVHPTTSEEPTSVDKSSAVGVGNEPTAEPVAEDKFEVKTSTESHAADQMEMQHVTEEHKVYMVPVPVPVAGNETRPQNLTMASAVTTTERAEFRDVDLWDNDEGGDFSAVDPRKGHAKDDGKKERMKETKEDGKDSVKEEEVKAKDAMKDEFFKSKDDDLKSRDFVLYDEGKSKSKGKKSKPKPEQSEDPRVELSAAEPVISRDGAFWDRVHPEATTTGDLEHEREHNERAHGDREREHNQQYAHVDSHEDPRIAEHPAPSNKTRQWYEELLFPENDAANDLHDDRDAAVNKTTFALGKSEKKKAAFESSRQLGAAADFAPKRVEEAATLQSVLAEATTERSREIGIVSNAGVTTENVVREEVTTVAGEIAEEMTTMDSVSEVTALPQPGEKVAVLNITELLGSRPEMATLPNVAASTAEPAAESTTSEEESLEEEDVTLNPLWLKINETEEESKEQEKNETKEAVKDEQMFLHTHLAHLIPYVNETEAPSTTEAAIEDATENVEKSSPGVDVTTPITAEDEETSTPVADETDATVMYVYDITAPSVVETTTSKVGVHVAADMSSNESVATNSILETTTASVEMSSKDASSSSEVEVTASNVETTHSKAETTPSVSETTPLSIVSSISIGSESVTTPSVSETTPLSIVSSTPNGSESVTTPSVSETTPLSLASSTPIGSESVTTPSVSETTPLSLASSTPIGSESVTTPPRSGLAEDSVFGDALDYSEVDVENRVAANVSAETRAEPETGKSDRLGLAAGFELDQDPADSTEESEESVKLSAFQRKLAAARDKEKEADLRKADKDDEAAKKKRKKEKDRQSEFAAKLAAKAELKKEAGSSEEGTMGVSERLVRPLSEGLEPANVDNAKKELGEKKVFKGVERLAKCNQGQWQCANGTARDGSYCVPARHRCDGSAQCSDQSDEAGCGGGAGCADNFRCGGGGECLARARVCDGAKDCADGADEADCESWSCRADEFACADRRCLPLSAKCDGVPDCADHGDEVGCQASCSDSEFLCPEGWCIPSTLRCDGQSDCSNGEDERGCQCAADEFRCERGGCVGQRKVCDGASDCADGSDEWRCLRLPRDTGRLEIRDWTSAWTPVCSDGWSASWSDAACRALGLSRSAFTEFKAADGAAAFRALGDVAAGTALPALANGTQCPTAEIVTLHCQEFTCGSHGPAEGVAARLAGGDAASTGQWPSVALLYHTKRHLSCAASIVAPGWVIASRACLAQPGGPLSARDWAVFAGGAAFDAGARPDTQIAQVAALTAHTGRWHGDLALARLEAPLRFGRGVGAVCLPETEIKPRQLCVTAGWDTPTAPGAVTFGRSLRWRPVPTLASAECNATRIYDGTLAADEICAGFIDQADQPVCHDESGAPLMCVSEGGAWELHGLLARDGNCERRRRPSVYVSVSAARTWIHNSIGA